MPEVRKKRKDKGYAELWVDGACKGNPGGHSGAGIILLLGGGEIIQRSQYLGRMNSNEAEYSALLAGLQLVQELPEVKKVRIRTDSELMYKQIKGDVRTRMDSLIELQDQILNILGTLESWMIQHVPRSKNGGADVLANRAAISKKTREDRKFDPKQADEEQKEALKKYENGEHDKVASQGVDIGTPWGSLGTWPEERPSSVLLIYDLVQGGFYVMDPDGTKLLWLGRMELPPTAQV